MKDGLAHRRQTYRKGLWAERYAAWFLRAKFYRIRACRYKTRYGEIDLIATKGRCVAFVEVKARKDMMGGLEAVHAGAQKRIADAAQDYMRRHPELVNYDWRFDAVVVRAGALPYHLKDAWRV